jgi:predicted CXXCH cytochrome family protein
MCHRAHTANTSVPYRPVDTTMPVGSSLLLSSDSASGDVALCESCHGIGQLGSNSDVETAFARSSVHSLVPSTAPYGPSPIECSSCHDAHGGDRAPGGAPWPVLLRSYSLESTTPVFTGEAYCATCHTVASSVQFSERWNGLAVYMRTGHYSGIATPTTGTGIRCSRCHDPHGSNIAPLLVASIVPTSVVTTVTVTADDRTFCLACHAGASASWSGTTTYATSSHALSAKTVTITARWVPVGKQKVGECQVCHAPMGHSDGAGGTIPKLLDAKGRVLCDRCHFAGTDSVASTDTSSQARPVAGALTLAAVYAPGNGTTQGIVSLYGRTVTGGGALSGPRQFTPADGTGPSAVGDVDGDHQTELVVASAGSATLTIYHVNQLTGLGPLPTVCAIPQKAVALGVGDILNAVPYVGYDEIALVDSAGDLRLYVLSGSTLEPVATPVAVGAGPWGLAVGNLEPAPALADVVVTSASDGTMVIAKDGGLGVLSSSATSVGVAPVAPSIGRLWNGAAAGQNQIAVGDAGSATSTIRVLRGSGAELAGYLVTAAGGGSPTASAIGDVLPSLPVPGRAELAMAFTNEGTGSSSVIVVPQLPSGSDPDCLNPTAAIEMASGAGTHTRSLLAGDVDNDELVELVAGDGGTWARTSSAAAPFLQIWHSDTGGATFQAAEIHMGGGTELAGAAPSLALAYFGKILPSRHPIDEVAVAHVSTETASFDRHVTCSDCHNSHEASTAVADAPLVSGQMKGAWGVTVTYPGGVPAFGAPARATNGYEICFKCHSSYVVLAGRPDVAAQTAPGNASMHAISQASTSTVSADTFVTATPAWTSASILNCTDCHGDDGRTEAQARGLHESASAPLLIAPYLGADPMSSGSLCYRCHKLTVYGTGAADAASGMSRFQETSPNVRTLHSFHVASPASGGHGLSCSACHVTHGSVTEPHLLRSDIGFTPDALLPHKGTCDNVCHTAPHAWPAP